MENHKQKSKKILLSGIKPTNRPHIGNYFGAMRQFVDLQDKYESYVFIADYHALTTLQNPKTMSDNIFDLVLDYLAIGLEPNKTTLFKQSDVPEVCELAWIFNCITTVPYLERAHAYKDALTKGKEPNVGLFDYPMLMAADILIQDADVVPAGQDQKQHIEYARDTAEKFNRIFPSTDSGQVETFKLPEPLILETVKTIPGIDGQKMSKTYNNGIPLFASDNELTELVMAIVTDSSAGVPKNVYELHKLFRSEAELTPLYQSKAGKYKELKEALVEDMIKFIAPLRAKREKLAGDREAILKILKEGGANARARAQEKMKVVRERVGVTL